MTLKEIQTEQVAWLKHNFPEFDSQKSYQALLGVVEEVGELSHAHLKREQNIRGTAEELDEKGKDAIGDIIIFLLAYCSAKSWDCEEIVNEVWSRVGKRDFVSDPLEGGEKR